MIENKFKLGQKVRHKDMPVECAFSIAVISLSGDSVYYAYDSAHVGVREADLELVKEKKKVTLFNPIVKDVHGRLYQQFPRYHSDKTYFGDPSTEDIVG